MGEQKIREKWERGETKTTKENRQLDDESYGLPQQNCQESFYVIVLRKTNNSGKTTRLLTNYLRVMVWIKTVEQTVPSMFKDQTKNKPAYMGISMECTNS